MYMYRSSNNIQNTEKRLAEKVKEYIDELGLKDCVEWDTDINKFTWQNIRNKTLSQSRIDRIYCSEFYANRCQRLTKKWGIGNSDHATLITEFVTEAKIRGKGIPKINPAILEKKELKEEIRAELITWVNNINTEWDPHTQWEYCKMALRSIIFPIMGRNKKKTSKRKIEILDEITQIKNNKVLCATQAEVVNASQKCIELQQELDKLLEEEADMLALQSGIKWREEGEKSTKYFLGLLNKKRNEGHIDALKDNRGVLRYKKNDLLDIVYNFYSNLYIKENLQNTLTRPTSNLHPKISTTQSKSLDEKITIDEIKRTLKTVKDSTPGEDGIPYSVYSNYIDIIGPYMVKSWDYSIETGKLSPSQTRSCISLIPKKRQRWTKNRKLEADLTIKLRH
jgi:hypothetical protein